MSKVPFFLRITITLEKLYKRGYESLLTYYQKVAPHLNEPLYTNGETLSNQNKVELDEVNTI